MNWQSIGTAPKDGTVIILFVPEIRAPHVRIGSFEIVEHLRFGVSTYKSAKWHYWNQWMALGDDDFQPTHWMPFPEPPASEALSLAAYKK